MNARAIIAGYLVLQSASTALWWIGLLVIPGAIDWFIPAAWPAATLWSFCLADWTIVVAGSMVTAYLVWQRHPASGTALWALSAGVAYPTLYCLGASVISGEAWLASAMMGAMLGATLALATMQGRGAQQPEAIRVIDLDSFPATLLTLAQTAIFWGLFLWLLPRGMIEVEQRLGWQAFEHPFRFPCGLALFLVASTLGLWSGWTMAVRGRGTPLPTATASRLVLSGPYRWVRNPMATAGIAQGFAVGWMTGSVTVIAYALIGAVLWHVVVRPIEERDLEQRFGEEYRDYRARVGLWLPFKAMRFPP